MLIQYFRFLFLCKRRSEQENIVVVDTVATDNHNAFV